MHPGPAHRAQQRAQEAIAVVRAPGAQGAAAQLRWCLHLPVSHQPAAALAPAALLAGLELSSYKLSSIKLYLHQQRC